MARKRKAPSSQKPLAQKSKIVPEEEVEEEEISDEEQVEEESEEESSSGEEESDSESESDEEEETSSESDEANDDASKREALRELLEPFGKSQIIDLLKETAANDSKLLTKIAQVADTDPTHRKIFVHGLGWDATSEQLLHAFRPFGEIEESKLITDKNTGRAKGYAFVVFKTRSAARKALKETQKRIGSRTVSCQLAALGNPAGTVAAAGADGGSKKMYVGNVGPNVNPEKLKAFFRTFGEIEDAPIGIDPVTSKFKGFAVITFKSPEGFKKALEEPVKVFENCQLHCKKFVENPNKNNNTTGQNSGGNMNMNMNPGVTDVSYGGLGVNPGMLGMMAQNGGMGFPGNAMMGGGYNAVGLNTPISGMSGNYGLNSMGPSVMGNYGSQAALQGLGAFQNAQTGQSSIGTAATATTASRAPASGVSPATTFPKYFGR